MENAVRSRVLALLERETGIAAKVEDRISSLVTDSLEYADLMLCFEGEFNLSILDSAQKLRTVADLIAYAEVN